MSGHEWRRIAVAVLAAAATAMQATASYLTSKPWTPVLIGAGVGAWLVALVLAARVRRRP